MTDGQLRFPGRMDVALTGNVNNWAPTGIGTSTSIYIDPDGNHSITGILAESYSGGGNAIERVLILHNENATNTVSLVGLSGSSSAANQFAWSGTISLGRGESIVLKYDRVALLWRLMATGKVPTGAGGSPGGSDTQVQYNDGGSFNGDSGLTWDETNDQLTSTHVRVSGVLNLTGDVAATVSSTPQNALSVTGQATAGILRINPDTADVTVNGIAAPSSPFNDGRVVVIENVGTGGFALIFENESGSASAADRIAMSRARFTLRNGACGVFVYDSASSRWRVTGSDTNVLQGMRIVSDGTLQGFYDQNGNELLQMAGVGNAVNHPAFSNATTGNGPTIQPGTGGDTNIDLNLIGRGTGMPKLGVSGEAVAIAGIGTTNPTATNEGSLRYRSDLDEWFYCDTSRSNKWLSVSRDLYPFGHSASDLAASTGLRVIGLATADGTDANYKLPFDCTLVGYSYSRADSDSSTFEVMANASTVKLTISSSATTGTSLTEDVDFSSGDEMWARIGSGAANAMSPRTFLVWIRRRAT